MAQYGSLRAAERLEGEAAAEFVSGALQQSTPTGELFGVSFLETWEKGRAGVCGGSTNGGWGGRGRRTFNDPVSRVGLRS